MPRDPFARVKSGEMLPGLPAPAWNAFLDNLQPDGLGGGPGAGRTDGAVEFRVQNTTGSALGRFGILQINNPLNDPTTALAQFQSEDVLTGTTPSATTPFVVFQEPVVAGGVGRARLLGLTSALVNVTDAAHGYAAPTTATDKLTSGTTGPARIVYKPSGTGDKWCKVLLLGQAAPAATVGPTVLSSVSGSDTIFGASGAGDTGSTFSQGSITGRGLYWVHLVVTASASSGVSTDHLRVKVNMSAGSTPSGVNLYLFTTDIPVCDGFGYIFGTTPLSFLVNVASPASAMPSLSLDWAMSNGLGGSGTVSGNISALGYIVQLRTDA